MGRILKTFIGNSRIVIFWPQYSKSNHFPEDITFNNRLWVLSFRTFQECCRLQECDKDSQIQSSIQYTCTTTKCIDNVLRVEVFVLNNFGMVINTIEARLFRVGFGKVNVYKSCNELSLFAQFAWYANSGRWHSIVIFLKNKLYLKHPFCLFYYLIQTKCYSKQLCINSMYKKFKLPHRQQKEPTAGLYRNDFIIGLVAKTH